MSLASCVPLTDKNKSKLDFIAKDKKEKNEAKKVASVAKKAASTANMPEADNDSSIVKMNSAELKVAVRKILDTNCLSCHGDGKNYQALANLAPSIEMIEKDTSLISPLGYSQSNLYQQITNGSMKVYLNNPKDAFIIKDWIISLSSAVVSPTVTPVVEVINAPLITKFSPDGANFEMGTTSVKLDIITDKVATCGHSSSDVDYNQMTRFSSTGDKSHSHTISKLKAGKYTYFVKCMDAAKKVSLSKEISFSIMDAVVVEAPSQENLRASVKKILDSSCLVCHGVGKKYQVIADLSMSIENMEKNTKLVMPKDLVKSKLYQAVTTGGMKVYLDMATDADVIKDWILSIAVPVETVPVVVDTKAPLITSFLPNNATYEDVITSAKLDVVTDEASSCAFTTNAAVVDYNLMTKFSMTGDKRHAHTVVNLKAGNYSFFVKCMDPAKNVSLSKEIKFSIKEVIIPVVVDTKAPLITSFLPNGAIYESTITSAKLDVVTDEAASCAFTTNAAVVDYNLMTKFTTTGAKAHSHSVINLKSGNYSYFVKCMDPAKNVSLSKETKFMIKAAPFIKLTRAELKVAVKKIFDTNCLVCHGAGKGFQDEANLAPSIDIIEKDFKLFSPGDITKSILYTKVTVGSMKVYLPDSKDADVIKEWIISIPKEVAPPSPVEVPMPAPVTDSSMKDYASEVQMATRSYVESVLLQVFDAEGTPAANYIQTDILQKVEFGGSCDLYASGDKGNTTVQFPREQCFNSIGIVQPPNNNPMRYSLSTKVCEKLVADKDRLSAVRKKIYENQVWGMPTDDKVQIAWRLFHQSTDIDANGINALKDLKNVSSSNDGLGS